MKELRTNRVLFLSLCLLGIGLTGFLVSHHYRRPPAIAVAEPPPADSPPAESDAVDTSRLELQDEPAMTTPFVQTPAVRRDRKEAAPASEESAAIPEDPDQSRAWARAHPAEALAWALKATNGPQRDAVMETVCPQVAETNAAAAVALAERAGSSCSNLLENMVLQWAQQDGAAAFAWTRSRPAGEERDRLFGRIAFVQSKTSPEEAARLIVEQMSPGAAQEEAAISVMHQWAQRDATAAMAWAQRFPEGKLRNRAIQEVQNLVNLMNGQGGGQPAL